MNETGIHEEGGAKEIEGFDIGLDKILKHNRMIPRSMPGNKRSNRAMATFHEHLIMDYGSHCRWRPRFDRFNFTPTTDRGEESSYQQSSELHAFFRSES